MDWKDKLSGLKSELPPVEETSEITRVQPAKKQQVEPLRVELDKRNGKPATLVTEFQGTENELKELAKLLKIKCARAFTTTWSYLLLSVVIRI